MERCPILKARICHAPASSNHQTGIKPSLFNRMCLAELASSCNQTTMRWLVSPFLALLLAVSILGATVGDISAELTADIAAATDPCCEGDCPDDRACDATCAMMAHSLLLVFWPLHTPLPKVTTQETAAVLLTLDRHPPSGLSPDGLRRPPRT